jgi:hypothetical protein
MVTSILLAAATCAFAAFEIRRWRTPEQNRLSAGFVFLI